MIDCTWIGCQFKSEKQKLACSYSVNCVAHIGEFTLIIKKKLVGRRGGPGPLGLPPPDPPLFACKKFDIQY